MLIELLDDTPVVERSIDGRQYCRVCTSKMRFDCMEGLIAFGWSAKRKRSSKQKLYIVIIAHMIAGDMRQRDHAVQRQSFAHKLEMAPILMA